MHHALVQPAVTDLKRKSVVGGVAAVSAQGAKFALQTATMMVLARLLSPEDFGLQGMVVVVTGFLGFFRDAGLGSATVQRLEVTREQTSTLFWINVAVGAILATLCAALAPLVAAFYHCGSKGMRSFGCWFRAGNPDASPGKNIHFHGIDIDICDRARNLLQMGFLGVGFKKRPHHSPSVVSRPILDNPALCQPTHPDRDGKRCFPACRPLPGGPRGLSKLVPDRTLARRQL
jgi:hypothetical protein